MLRAAAFAASRASLARPSLSRLSSPFGFRLYTTPATAMGGPATQTVNTNDRLAALRKLMSEKQVDAFIVPSEDPRKCFIVGVLFGLLAHVRIS